jgi:hypothetical protein
MTTQAVKQEDKFEFEVEGDTTNTSVEAEKVDLDVEDDTPEEDRGRTPLPADIVAELEADELDDYSEKVKVRLKQMKKVWHDERREKERAIREQQEALRLAQQVIGENKRLKSTLTRGEQSFLDTTKSAAQMELDIAKRMYRDAYEAGDTDKVIEAQEKLSTATYKWNQVNQLKTPLQQEESEVERPQQPAQYVPEPDTKTLAWQKRNTWWGTNRAMTALALGYHQELVEKYGPTYVGTDEYWNSIDNTMRQRFPDQFEGEPSTTAGGGSKSTTRTETKPATVVAPASRSTSSKKIVLKQSQLTIAKKLGLTPEQYAREYAKTLEK